MAELRYSGRQLLLMGVAGLAFAPVVIMTIFMGLPTDPHGPWLFRLLGPQGSTLLLIGFAACCLIVGVVHFRLYLTGARIAATADRDGLTLITPFRQHRLLWSEVQRVSITRQRVRLATYHWLRVDRFDGSFVRLSLQTVEGSGAAGAEWIKRAGALRASPPLPSAPTAPVGFGRAVRAR